MQKIVKLLIFSIVVFSLLVNLANYSYVKYYMLNYAPYNESIKSAYNDYIYSPVKEKGEKYFNGILFSGKEDNYKTVCLSMKPAMFLQTYNQLSSWASLMAKISLALLFVCFIYAAYLIIAKKKISKKYFGIVIAILVISMGLYVYSDMIEITYDWVGCGKYLLQ